MSDHDTSSVPTPLPGHSITELLSEAEIQGRVAALGAIITRDYPDTDEPLLLVGVLKGATLFLADLLRSINRPVEFRFRCRVFLRSRNKDVRRSACTERLGLLCIR